MSIINIATFVGIMEGIVNTKNNKRRRGTEERIERAFIELLQTRELSSVTVSELCTLVGVNRSTFYANYIDIYDLADKIRDKLEAEVMSLYENDLSKVPGDDYIKLFYHIRANQLFYQTYFKLGYDGAYAVNLGKLCEVEMYFPERQLEYHLTFHRAGLNAVIKKWLADGCREAPEVIAGVIRDEYTKRS